MTQHRDIGLAIVGAGRIGTLRARLAARHPAVRFIAISDEDPKRAEKLAREVGAQFHSGDNLAAISRPEVNSVVVATSENQHTLPILQALEHGRAVLVEKPLGTDLAEAKDVMLRARHGDVDLHVGYSRRFKHRYLRAKEQILQGKLGDIVGGFGRLFNLRTQAFAIMDRDPHATPVVDALTYYVDLMGWFLEGRRVVEVVARGNTGVLKKAGYAADDVVSAMLTYDDGAVISLGLSYALPAQYPSLGHSARVELLGTAGTLLIDDDHKDQVLYTEHGTPHVYLPDHTVNMMFLGSSTPGDWALGDFWGPLASETRAWLDHLSTGAPCALATPSEAYANLAVTLAIEEAARTRKPVEPEPFAA